MLSMDLHSHVEQVNMQSCNNFEFYHRHLAQSRNLNLQLILCRKQVHCKVASTTMLAKYVHEQMQSEIQSDVELLV